MPGSCRKYGDPARHRRCGPAGEEVSGLLVKDVMRSDVVVVLPSARLTDILAILQRRGVRHVPVVKDGVLLGIVSDRDVKGAMLSAAASRPQDVAGALC